MSTEVLVVESPQIEVVEVDGGVDLLEIAADIELLEIGIQGPAGVPGSGGPTIIEFAWGDATPSLIGNVAAGKNIYRASINIETPFNGTGAALSIGPIASPQQLMSQAQVDPTAKALYQVSPGIEFGGITAVYLHITPGSGASAGKGQAIIEVEP